ncbi:MAG: tRNA 5-methoxyuridine(34)/uridine 5-oxyacetic acid(34) synthase CmoB [Bdellovibrionales bacterium]|nr:tRNA 5-methoxyuridine(34)/uridine 5-oxyacetic acid(34) synthase CmoB [Bdellovibrionales bacterium]
MKSNKSTIADGLAGFSRFLNWEGIEDLRRNKADEVARITHWGEYRNVIEKLHISSHHQFHLSLGDVVTCRGEAQCEAEYSELIRSLVQILAPWRKGPFNLLGTEIDAEWRSDWKWNRIDKILPDICGKRVVDVGCNNGYYLFRLLERNPQFVLGLDPSSRSLYQFDLIQRFAQNPRLGFELFGIEDLPLFPEFFHLALCMGVIYHRRDPYTGCRQLFECLKPGGTLIMESLVYPGDDPIALCPPERYAMMRNVWYVPTVSCLEGWLRRAGFSTVEVIDVTVITVEEQRQTQLAPYASLSDFLDPNSSDLTVEGYPPPTRAILKAVRK